MIVRSAGGVLHLITQPDHAALSRRIMERWTPLHGADRRQSILLAVEEHDNGWHEPDAHPSVDSETGRVLDFITVPAAVRQGIWPRGVARVAEQDQWAAALVAEHALTVYARFRPESEWAGFFEQMTAIRDALIHQTGGTRVQLAHDYGYVRIGDLLSLIFCNLWQEEQVYNRWRMQLDDRTVTVTPDAFDGHRWPIAVTARELPDVPYGSDEELQHAMRMAPRITLHGVISGAA